MSRRKEKVQFAFYRDYQRYTGGHQKFRDYLEHTAALPNTECSLYVENSCSIMPNLFKSIPNVSTVHAYQPENADVAFLAGMDWNVYLKHKKSGQNVVNLVQHVRHADPTHPLHSFLSHRALRICVSEAVRQAILPFANGDCVTIKMGHTIPIVKEQKQWDLYILGKKNPKMAETIENWAALKNMRVRADSGLVSREAVFSNLAKARVALVLPNPTEGFFLPGIEAMALADRVVVPDCVGNREYCQPYTNITLCDYNAESCIKALEFAFDRLNTSMQMFEKFRGVRSADSYNMQTERSRYQEILENKGLI